MPGCTGRRRRRRSEQSAAAWLQPHLAGEERGCGRGEAAARLGLIKVEWQVEIDQSVAEHFPGPLPHLLSLFEAVGLLRRVFDVVPGANRVEVLQGLERRRRGRGRRGRDIT